MIYLDFHATTPVDPEVFETMKTYFCEEFGNAASANHQFGWTAQTAVEKSRKVLGSFIGAPGKDIVFTSGATESNNLALFGVAETYREKGNHIVTTQTEHKSVLDSCVELEKRGFKITYLEVDSFGRVTAEQINKALTPQTILVSVMGANNEIGTLQPIKEIGKITREKNIIFHTDGVQAVGYLKMDVEEMNVDLLSFSSHKIYGPKGIGALYVRSQNPRIKLKPIIYGGGHEKGLRSGTLNVPGIVGFAKAAELVMANRDKEFEKVKALRDRLQNFLSGKIKKLKINGHPTERLPNNLNMSFEGVDGASLLGEIKELCVSTGSACSSAQINPSHVLTAIGLSPDLAMSTLRLGLGRMTTPEDVENAGKILAEAILRLSPGQ